MKSKEEVNHQSNLPLATTQNAKAWWSPTGGGRSRGSGRTEGRNFLGNLE